MIKFLTKILLCISFLFLTSCNSKPKNISVYATPELIAKVQYGIEKLKEQLKSDEIELTFTENRKEALLVLIKSEKNADNDGYIFFKKEQQANLLANNQRGFIYGLQYISEQLQQGIEWNDLDEKEIEAHYGFRAIKFNLPWHSYRKGKHLSLHYDTCKDLKFWESFLDMMSENKFNVLSLWNLHPYIYMVESDKFPKARSFTAEEMAAWKSFFKSLFKMAKDRGIETYVFNWNIFVSDEFSDAYNVSTNAKTSIRHNFWGSGETNQMLEEYTREMVTKTINEYEDLTGIGITLGERMGGMTSEQRKDWIDRTMVQAIKDANREVKLFYRAPLSAGLTSHGAVSKSTEILTREAIENINLKNDVHLGFKFNWSHGHSSPKLCIVHGGILTDTYWDPKPTNYKGVYTVRNEDFFMLRWAQPDFIREYLNHNSQDYIGGAIIGSETYIPAKDFITKDEHRSWNYAFERQWLFYKVWGNLLYNNKTPDSYFEAALNQKFGITKSSDLLKGWKLSSMNANRFATFYQGKSDGTLYTEGFFAKGKFININEFIEHPVLDSSYVNIKDFVANKCNETQTTPLQLAETTEKESVKALEIAALLKEKYSNNKLLQIELNDIEAWSYFGLYFASKIKAGVALETYRQKGNKAKQQEAIEYLEKGLQHWIDYSEKLAVYNNASVPNIFRKSFSFRKQINAIKKDILTAKEANK
ncbi:hypothetical protein [Wenyingzhuangia sp. IMCC45574]